MALKPTQKRKEANVIVVVVVLTLTRIIKSVEEYHRETKHKQPKVVHAYITADAIHASTRNI